MSKSTKEKVETGAERRRSKRMDILDTFSLFAVVPAKGPLRLTVHDISDAGIGFDLDIEEEQGSSFQAKVGASFDIHLYLNQSLYIPLTVEIRRIVERGEKGSSGAVRQIGAEFAARGGKGHTALLAFLDMLDAVSEAGRIES